MTDEKPAPTFQRPEEPAPSADPAAVGEPTVVPIAGEPIPAGPAEDFVVVHAPAAVAEAEDGPAHRAPGDPQGDGSAPVGSRSSSSSSPDADREDGEAPAAPVAARSVTDRQPSSLPDGPVSGPLDDEDDLPDAPAVTADPHAERAPVVAVAAERGAPAPVDELPEHHDAAGEPVPVRSGSGEPRRAHDAREPDAAPAAAVPVAAATVPAAAASAPSSAALSEATPDESHRDDDTTKVLPAAVERAEPSRNERTEALRAETAPVTGTVPAEAPRTIYVEAPVPPRKKGNRVFGILMSLLSALVFALVWAGVVAVIISVGAPERFAQSFSSFLTSWAFWLPVVGYALGMVLLSLIVGKGGWAWWLIGGFLVAVIVYFAYLGGAVLTVAPSITAAEVQGFVREVALTPLSIGAAVVAREVSIWTGLAIAARGKRVKAKNTEARAAFDRDQAERRALQPA